LTLPFVSFGGSSLLVNAAAAGILLNVSRQAPQRADALTPQAPPVVPVAPSAPIGAGAGGPREGAS